MSETKTNVVDRILAGVAKQTEAADLLSFTLNGQMYLALSTDIEAILEYPESVTTIPSTHNWYKGVIRYRGMLLPLVGIGHFIYGDAAEASRAVFVIRLPEGKVVGLAVDNYREFYKCSEASLSDVGVIDIPDIMLRHCLGVCEVQAKKIPLINLYKLATSQKINEIQIL